MVKELKLSQQLTFRGWDQRHVSALLKLEMDNEELLKENKELKSELRRHIREKQLTAKENRR
jgi:hypothetical protein